MVKTAWLKGVAVATLIPLALPQDTTVLTSEDLKKALDGMGLTTKDIGSGPGKEKFEFKMTAPGFDVPVGAEISPSKNYIWLTVNLGTAAATTEKGLELLKSNAKTQPNFFYVTEKGNLFMGCPIDNRGVDAAVLKRVSDKLVADVGKTSTIWNVSN